MTPKLFANVLLETGDKLCLRNYFVFYQSYVGSRAVGFTWWQLDRPWYCQRYHHRVWWTCVTASAIVSYTNNPTLSPIYNSQLMHFVNWELNALLFEGVSSSTTNIMLYVAKRYVKGAWHLVRSWQWVKLLTGPEALVRSNQTVC
jgi:hypothetical protein